MVPVAGSATSFGISMIMSGVSPQPSWNVIGAGLSFSSPSAAPPSAQAEIALMSASLSRLSLAK
jgi:hypothetical protein